MQHYFILPQTADAGRGGEITPTGQLAAISSSKIILPAAWGSAAPFFFFYTSCSPLCSASVPRDAREYIGSLFSDLYVAEQLAGGSGHDANHRRVRFIMSLQATVVRANARMALVLSAPPPVANAPAPSAPPTPAAAPPPAAAT